ncbi:MAG: hypothetical protein HDR88_05055 [Bacteroides sp.]|nr:hypothetical protein [Bacteroides sp.]
MKRFFTFLSVSLLCGSIMLPAAPKRILPSEGSQLHRTVRGNEKTIVSNTNITPQPLKVKYKASVENESEILFEDFNEVPDGATETIGNLGERYIDCIASHYVEPGRYIDPDYTPNSGTWEGDCIFAGEGGTVIMQCNNPSEPAVLRTPLGDYAGDITVTVRCRFSTPFYGADNDWGYVTTFGTQLSCRAGIGGYDVNNDAITDIEIFAIDSKIFYESEGWNEITFKFRNESANSDGFIELRCPFAIEIDWVKITDAGTFLAAPVVDPVTEFYNDGFTINWSPVRHSYDYYIDLWKMEYTGDSTVHSIDFDTNPVPNDWNYNDSEISNDVGTEGTNALRFNNNGVESAFETPVFSEKIASLSYSAMFEINDETAINGYGIYGMLFIDGLTENGWEPIQDADLYCDGALTVGGTYYDFTLSGESFSDRYTALRIYEYGVLSDNHLVIDNVNLHLQKPYKLVRVIGEENGAIRDTENDDADYNRYYFTGNPYAPCSYTFKNLDPEGEYFYRVRSHNVSEFAGTEKHHAFGVATPVILPATDINSKGYTANWEEVAKAQTYVVSNYKLTILDSDEDNYCILKETFSNCNGGSRFDSMIPLDNVELGNLDDYTDMHGWTGMNNYLGDTFIGGDWFTDTKLITPPLSIDPEKEVYEIYLEAYGYQGDMLYIEFEKAGIYTTIPFNGNLLEIRFEAPAVSDGERLRFYSYNFMPYALNHLEISQNKSKGDIIRTFDSEKSVPAGIGHVDFDNLDENEMYEYSVKARFDLESKTVYSFGNDVMRVDLSNGAGINMNDDLNIYEIGRYDMNGLSVDKNYKGFVIIKMSDGTTKKMMAR